MIALISFALIILVFLGNIRLETKLNDISAAVERIESREKGKK
jgi:hypothetical protein